MNYRTLGKTGNQISEISFGGVEIGLPYGIGIKGKTDMISESDAINLLNSAIDRGINFFDTARMYGSSETLMGKAFKNKRDKVVISTKCTHLPSGKLAPVQTKALIESSLKESLSALQTDYIDVYKLHNATLNHLRNDAILNTFSKLKKDGVIRATGVSTYTIDETKTAIEQGVWDVIQLSFNLMDQRQADMFDLALQAGIGIVVRSVLLKGILTDRGRNLHPALKNVSEHRDRYQELMDESTATLSSLSMKFVLSFSQVSSVLVGIDRMEYLENALATADGHYLNGEKLKRAQQLAYPEPGFLDLPEWDQKGWLT